MRLHLSALKVHLAHCAATGAGRYIGLTFTPSGIPMAASVPKAAPKFIFCTGDVDYLKHLEGRRFYIVKAGS